jgi:putative glutamine amidotransferase
MKKVLVPMAVQLQEKTIAPLHFTRATYIKKLVKYGLMPVFVSSIMTERMLIEAYEECGGVLFVGGTDFNPDLYCRPRHEKTEVSEPARDSLELFILQRAVAERKTFLGICRGCQALAIVSGGTLHQHLPDTVKNEDHGIGEGKTYDDLLTNQKHSVVIDEDSKFIHLVGSPKVLVNSGHHQSVDDAGKDIRIVGRSPEGVAEILEHTDPNYFCYGIQSHPEAEEESFFESVFEAFADAVKDL